MCGLIGGWSHEKFRDLQEALPRMTRALAHRGPDDDGHWFDPEVGVALGHRRLAIVDLSPAGHQPMVSPSGRWVIAFNGEIYNHQALRTELDAAGRTPSWRGHSDTETLLACIEAWGVEPTLKRSVGMFAFALWDRRDRSLVLARDRLGEKPLYYGWCGNVFLFGSDLKAMREYPAFDAGVDRNALSLYMRHNYIPAPFTIHPGILKLPPGTWLHIHQDRRAAVPSTYWSLPAVAEAGVATPFGGRDTDAIDALESLLKDAVGQQMVADVPLGAFLSGGVDSSTIVALMQAQSRRPIKTFTIGFNEDGYDEAAHALQVAQHLGTDHTELYVTPQQALDVIPRLPQLYSEPFSDSSQIPTFLVSQIAREHVTVSLSGDAGDELFGGYARYTFARDLWRKIGLLPRGLGSFGAAGIRALSPERWNRLAAPLRPIMPGKFRHANWGDKLHKGAALLDAERVDDLYLKLVTHWEPDGIVKGAVEPPTHLNGKPLPLHGLDDVQRMMALDSITYLPDDILVKVDRAAMGVSLETRVPFLDHRVVEFAWQLPQHMKVRGNVGKWALRQVLYRHVPKRLIDRPKMGFGVPIDDWLRGPLRDWAEGLLGETRLKSEGYFDPRPIRQKWAEHLSGTRNWQYHLWDVLMFQAWLDENKSD
jgi:asparagine synthase (glutamine-hydrolysing)